jgi:nucleoside-diphosphate-sugar epimerase
MSKILLTGSTGFVGKNLLPKLINLGYDVIQLSSKDGDIAKEETWINLPQTEIVIHLASKTSVPESWTKSYDYINCNLMGTVNALNYCKQHNSKLIFISSYIYGNPDQLPINENVLLKPTNPYALSKLLSEQACEYYSKSENVKTVILRPFNIFGPGQSDNYLIQFIISQLETSNIIKVKDLIPKRDYIYIDDFTDAIVKSLTLNTNFNIFNIGSGKSYSVKEVIDIIQKLLNTDASVESENERRKNEIMDTIADISMANQILNWSPKISFIEGIQNILNKN